jgi:hypothetical protein
VRPILCNQLIKSKSYWNPPVRERLGAAPVKTEAQQAIGASHGHSWDIIITIIISRCRQCGNNNIIITICSS